MIRRNDIQVRWRKSKDKRTLICEGCLHIAAQYHIDYRHIPQQYLHTCMDEADKNVRENIIRHLYANVQDKREELHKLIDWIMLNINPTAYQGIEDFDKRMKPLYDLLKNV